MPLRLRSLMIFVAASLLLPCAAAAQSTLGRPSDGLLERPTLQRLVAWQVERQGDSLRAALGRPDAVVRARAAFALASVQDSTATPALLRALRDSSAAVRADAAFALGQAPGAVPADSLLATLRRESDETARRLLLEALGKQGDVASLEQFVASGAADDQPAAGALALGRYGLRDVVHPEATAWLLEHLRADDALTRLHAAYFFARTDPALWADHTPAVQRALDQLDPDDLAAMHLLRGLGRQEAVEGPRVGRFLTSAPDWRVRTEAARALAASPDTAQALAALRAALRDSSAHVAGTAAGGLAGLAPWPAATADSVRGWLEAYPDRWRVAAPLLTGLARQGDTVLVAETVQRWGRTLPPEAYAAGLGALRVLDDRTSLQALGTVAETDNQRVATAALDALAQRWQRRRTDLSPTLHHYYLDVFTRGFARGDLAMMYVTAPVLADSLFQPQGADVLRRIYGRLDAPRYVEPMTRILTALGQTPDTAAVRLLREEAGHPHPVIQRAAAEALAARTGEPVPVSSDAPPYDGPALDWDYLQEKGPRPQLVLNTEKGRVVLELDAEQAPLTAQTILQLAEQGAYDGVPFHRVVPNFVVQGGDIERGDGFGGPAYSLRSEFTRIPYARGTLGMASAGKDTEGSQFFVTHSMQPHLDGRYTAFGTVREGMDVVDRLYAYDVIQDARVLGR